MTLEGLLIILGVAVALAGSITLVWPVPRVWISNRRRAGLVLAAGGAACQPPNGRVGSVFAGET